jgi:baculoviral IAP repeat-containing protein 6
MCCKGSVPTSAEEYQWACFGIQKLLVSLIKKEKLQIARKVTADKVTMEEEEISVISQKCLEISTHLEVVTDDGNDITSVDESLEQLSTSNDAPENNKPLPSCSDLMVDDGPSDDIKHKSEPSSIPQSKPKLKSQRRSFVHLQNFMKQKSTKSNDDTKNPFSHHIISNAINSRLVSDVQLPSELHLQCMSKAVYRNILESIDCAKPQEKSILNVGSNDEEENGNEILYDGPVSSSLHVTLLKVIEEMFNKRRQSAEVFSLLQFWNEICGVALKHTKKNHLMFLFETSNLFSYETLSNLLDLFLVCEVTSWNSIFSLLFEYVRLSYKTNDKKVNINVDKLVSCLMHCCVCDEVACEVGQYKEENCIFDKLMCQLSASTIQMMEGGNELNGCQMLLDLLTRILKERSTLPPFNPYIQTLIQTLQQPSILETLFISSSPLPSSSSHPLQSIKSFLSVVLLKLCQTISYTRHYPFKLWGTAVPDGERNRKFYYSSAVTAVQDLSWMKLEQPPSGALNLSSALVKLCKDILSMKVPSSVLPDIEKYCDVDHTHDHTHTGSYSVQDKPLVDLILKDQKQLTELFLNLRYTQSCDDDYSHLNDFVSFLQSSCSDFSCFARPLLVAMDTWCWTVGGSSEPRHSIFYLIKSLTSERKRDEGIEADYLPDNGSITSFITQGGGHAIMKCLILSASSVKATPINHTLKDSLINLEMQDRPLPYKESSPLINFFPMCTTKCSPSSDSLKDLQSQSVKLKDGPNRSSSFQHTFNKDDKWIKFYMTLKQPILLHQIHIYQPAIYTQNGPSLVKVEVSNLENPGRPIPLSLPINTAGLTGIKIELTTPIIIQEVWIHLYRPLLPQPISLSNFLLLGTHYGSSSSSHTPNNDMTNASYDIIHPSEGWIDILNQWLSSSSQVAVELSSIASEMNVLQTCLSLLTQPLRSQALKGLGSLLLKLSSNCSEVGDQLIPLLIKDMRTKSTANHLLDDGYVIDLILSVCSLEDTSGQRRLMSALELINELTSHDNGDVEHNSLQHLSPVILTLASIIWRQKDILESDQCSIKISDNFYKSLLNCAVSKEVGSALKLSLNALQTSLCRLNPSWFSIAMETATQLVETTPMDGIGRVLHTLSHCSLSDECIKILLDSTFLQDLLDRLVKSLSVIEQDPALHIMTQHLSLVCSSLAFLTDLAFGHREAQSWLVKRENAYFWPILLKTFDKPFLNISKVQLSFCHHTIQQFFAVCYKFNINGKNFLSRLIISAFSGQYSLSKLPPRGSEPLVLKLTPFIKSLMVDHLMNQESIHLILEIRPDVTESIAHVIDIEHLMPTYKSPHYHPSFPLDRNFYYLKLSSEYSLSRLISLLFSGVSERPFDIKYFFPPLTYIPKFASSEVASTMPPGINVFNFSIKKDSSPVDKTYKSLCFRVGKDGLRLPHNARIKDVPLTATFSCSHVRLLSLSKVTNEEIYCDIETKITQPTLLQAFANMNGLSVLAELFPYMHPSYWLGDDDRNAMVDVDLSAASIPFDLPHYFTPRSYTAFGLGLRLKEYGELLGCDGTVTNSWYIFRSVLGVNDEGKSLSSSLSDFFSFLPFLYVYRMVKDSSSENLRLRRNMLAKGLIKHLLDCLAVASQQPQEPKESVMIPSTTLPLPSNSATTSNEKQYWAKGTGFGTGSISSSWSVNDILSQHQANEVMTSIILATLAEWLRVPIDYYYKTYTGLDDDEKSHQNPHLDTSDNYIFFAEMCNILESSCLLPTLASYLTNDSILDITNHTQVYKAVLLLILSMCRNTHCHPLLMVDIAPPNGDGNPQHSQRRNIVSLIKHLNSIALVYNKTIKSQKKNPKNVSSQIPTMKQRPLPLPPDQPSHFASSSQEPIEISEVIELILKCGKEITYIQSMEDASTDSAAITTTDDGDSMCTASNDDYIASMKQLQFGTHQMIESELDENSKVIFKVTHYYSNKVEGIPILNPARSRRLAQEITSLASSLPLSTSSSVFVRCDEERMDLMKVLITGPSDTPYANGCFLFDVFFPPEYPSVPMSINLCTTGHGSVRFNPNLYNDGKVCLSVLNTWHGRPEEKWNPLTSSFLQVLVSIQSLILVAEPFFNEPGYEQYRGTPYGDLRSLSYNAVVCNATLQWAMIDIIKNPCPCFKEVCLFAIP